jgi:NAD(P)-dependent dehydrogenase (short-subunit alcohol dehydrogenase family)
MRLNSKVSIVTGASSGIGRGIALKFGEEGAAVVNADIRSDPKRGEHFGPDVAAPTHRLVEEEGGEGTFVQTDVSDPEQCEALVKETVDRYGRLDILVNNAGIHVPGTAGEISVEDWQDVVGVNLSGQFYCAKFALPHLVDTAGTMINISSVHAIDGGAGPPYAASKAGVVNMTKDIAASYGKHDVTVNAICPGQVETPLNDYLTEEQLREAAERTPLPRVGTPEDVAEAATFLASEAAEWITGEALFVDGGWTSFR